MKRRHFLAWITRVAGSYFGLTAAGAAAPHLLRINSVRLGEAKAQVPEPCVCETNDECLCEGSDGPDPCPTDGTTDPCSPDTCTTQDGCTPSDATVRQCQVSDVCDTDVSGDCRVDSCGSDSSGDCRGDSCTLGDSSAECVTDTSTSNDSSQACTADSCTEDSSGYCVSDDCTADSAGQCVSDDCTSDKSGVCVGDTCTSDSSGFCRADNCPSDSSGACRNDECSTADASGACVADLSESDSSKGCTSDQCDADSSGTCVSDSCTSDSSGECTSDTCSSDKSGGCTGDECQVSDSSGAGKADRCVSDSSGDCAQADVCVHDQSGACDEDLCRQDSGGDCSTRDTCALDLTPAVSQVPQVRRLNRALRWLYRISALLLAFQLQPPDAALAATVIDARDAAFSPTPSLVTAAPLAPVSAEGAFLRDCDDDGFDEADTNGDNDCTGDPELRDYDNDGSRELPPGTPFAGSFQFRCFHVPDDVALVTSGAVSIAVAGEAAVFGSVFAADTFSLEAPGLIDLCTSAWLGSAGAALSFRTAQAGSLDQTPSGFTGDVPDISFQSICALVLPPAPIPLLGGLATALFALLLALTGMRRMNDRS